MWVLLLVVVLVVAFVWAVRMWRPFPAAPLRMDPRVQAHWTLYQTTRQLALVQSSSSFKKETTGPLSYRPATTRPSRVLAAEYAPHVNGCDLTVVFFDPRLADPYYGPGQAAWFALESAATFLPHNSTCLALLTSRCAMERYLQQQESSSLAISPDRAIRDKVYAAALPQLRQWMHTGRVRLTTTINHTKYHLAACDNFGNPTPALVNHHFWSDEFVPADADTILMLQDDAVLCRSPPTLDATSYALVGAVWPRVATRLAPNPPEGMCFGMPALWKLLTLHMKPDDYIRLGIDPRYPSPCEDLAAPIGNGGFSWRSRAWMQRAIQTCPHVHWSGVANASTSPCRALDGLNEDYYFGTVLRGLRAPLPSGHVASLLAVESLFPHQVVALYGADPPHVHDDDAPVIQLASDQSSYTVPIGFHKPWWYHSNDILLAPDMQQACPFLPLVFTPNMSKWTEPKDAQKVRNTG